MVFIGIVVLFVSQLFICQRHQNRSDKSEMECTSSPAQEVFHLQCLESVHILKSSNKTASSSILGRIPNLQGTHVTSSSAIYLLQIWGLGPWGNHNGGWQEEIGNCWGDIPLPFWPAGPAEPLCPSRHQGARACQASRMQTCPHHPGVLSPDQPSPRWDNMSPFSFKLVEDTAMLIFLKTPFCLVGFQHWIGPDLR